MSIKEQVAQTLDYLDEDELQQVAEYLSFLRFRARIHAKPSLDVAELAALYSEFADKDHQLAEEGMEEYITSLQAEDSI